MEIDKKIIIKLIQALEDLKAKILGADPGMDLAVLQIDK